MVMPTQAETFTMFGAREIIDRTGGAVHIAQQVAVIEKSISTAPAIVFDLCRALVETTCKTILSERGIACESMGYKDLLRKTYSATSLLPERFADDQFTAEKIRELVDGLDAVLACVTHLRHAYGMASHGKEAATQTLDPVHALLAARAADALVHFLYMAHKFFFEPTAQGVLQLSDNPRFNEHLDTSNDPVRILELEYAPSEVLFQVDREAYKSYLAEFGS